MRPRQLRAPADDGAVLAEPPFHETGAVLAANRRVFLDRSFPFVDKPWENIRKDAGQQTVAAACAYLRDAGEPVPEPASGISLLVAGHQPELFHPGVWLKNFALHELARAHGSIPVNLVVDNDTVKSTAIRIPVVASNQEEAARTQLIDFDRWSGEVPYEECRVGDEALFESLPERVRPLSAGWPFVPLLGDFWQEVRRQARRTSLLGERFAASRRTWERAWGCHNLELPLSALCRTEAFGWFFLHILAELRRFHEIHNTCLAEYRQLYGLRSRSHPAPDLDSEDEWLEAPFWAWRSTKGRRCRLLVRSTGQQVELRLDRESESFLRLAPGHSGPGLWEDLDARGVKVRTRALTTTLFARLFLADLFIHGIGGAKYDEITDEIVRRFYGFEPPAYMVLSGTLLLPLEARAATAAEARALRHEARDLHCNPQRHFNGGRPFDGRSRALAAEKEKWIAAPLAGSRARRERYLALQDITARLRPYVSDREQHLRATLIDCERRLQTIEVLKRRDFAFCLFPEAKLRRFCTQMLGSVRVGTRTGDLASQG
jgi:hypothetical protein